MAVLSLYTIYHVAWFTKAIKKTLLHGIVPYITFTYIVNVHASRSMVPRTHRKAMKRSIEIHIYLLLGRKEKTSTNSF